MAQDDERALVDRPGWMVLCLVWSGWSAASSGLSVWLRIGWLVFFVAWAVLLVRHVIRRRRGRSSPPSGLDG
ncbi:hypothetical protein AB0942_31910 [Streptomyces nodosus]|uniref:hypothetical protein n=1 Tax=Streptomyces nodosus TaxID=40318 RepID=UPI0034567F76